MPENRGTHMLRKLRFDDLAGWPGDDLATALAVFGKTAHLLTARGWTDIADALPGASDARAFFERHFQPVLIGPQEPGKITGYYEPELDGARRKTAEFSAPIYRAPNDLPPDSPWLTRSEIEKSDALAGQELAWLRDPVDAFFLQVQGSGRIRLDDGSTMRVGFGGKNGHPYRSIGRFLIDHGNLPREGTTADDVKAWLRANPDRMRSVLWHNDSFVFFRTIDTVSAEDGPIGTMGQPVTAMRSLAVDPDFIPLGAPVWLEMPDMCRLTIAQDTGSAIKGPQRADLFFGTGDDAGHAAGALNSAGRLVTFLPKAMVP